MDRKSDRILRGAENAYYRATFKSMGFSDDDVSCGRPLIGIANAWSECVPGHYNLRQVAEKVKAGVYKAGGTAVEFGVMGGCDGIAQGHVGMNYILPSRELIANSVESMAQINQFEMEMVNTKTPTYMAANENLQAQYSVYPNPGKEDIIVSAPHENSVIRFYNMQGRLLLAKPFDFNTTVNASEWASGIYLWEIWNGTQKEAAGKWVKE